MLRRLLLVLSTLAVVLSVQSRPATSTHQEAHRPQARPMTGSPMIISPLSPNPLGGRASDEPRLLQGHQYQVVKRDPSSFFIVDPMDPMAAAKHPGTPGLDDATLSAPTASKNKNTLMPRYVAQRERLESNYLSNVGPAVSYPSYPSNDIVSSASAAIPSATPETLPGDVKKDKHAGQKGKEKGKETKKKHKSG